MDLSGQRISVRIANLARVWRHIDIDYFVAGGEHGHLGFSVNHHPRSPDSRSDCDTGVVESCAGRKQYISAPALGASRNDVFARSNTALDLNSVLASRAVLDHQHRISARWNRSAGHDCDRLPRLKRWNAFQRRTCPDLGNDFELRRNILDIHSSQGIAIARGTRKRREVSVSMNWLGEHTSRRVEQCEQLPPLRTKALCVLFHEVAGVFEGEHQRWVSGGHIGKESKLHGFKVSRFQNFGADDQFVKVLALSIGRL